MVHPPFIPQRDGPLARTTFTLAHQEAAVDPAAQQILGGISGYWPVIPGMFLQAVDRGDVVAWDPSLAIFRLGFTPFPIVIIP